MPASPGDLAVVVTGHVDNDPRGARSWLEHELGEVVEIADGRVIGVRLALTDTVVWRAQIEGLIEVVTFPASRIEVAAVLATARDRGQPLTAMDDVRALAGPYLIAEGTVTQLRQPS